MIDRQFIEMWSDRLRTEIPEAAAVMLKGSYVHGTAGPWSDLDFDVLVERPTSVEEYRTWLVDGPDGHLVHVSVAVEDVRSWLDAGDEAATWAFGFPSREVTSLLWARDEALRERLGQPYRDHPAADPELEDFIEELGKARNALSEGMGSPAASPARNSRNCARPCSDHSTSSFDRRHGRPRWRQPWISRSRQRGTGTTCCSAWG